MLLVPSLHHIHCIESSASINLSNNEFFLNTFVVGMGIKLQQMHTLKLSILLDLKHVLQCIVITRFHVGCRRDKNKEFFSP